MRFTLGSFAISEKEGMEAEGLYHAILQGLQEPVLVWDRDRRILFTNPAAERLTGWPAREVLGMPLEEITGSGLPDGLDSGLGEAAADCGPAGAGLPGRIVTRAGTTVHLRAFLSPLSAEGSVQGTIAVLRAPAPGPYENKDDRVEAPGYRELVEDALRAGKAMYQRFIEAAQEGIWILDDQGRIVFANGVIGAMLGSPVEEMLGRSVLDFVDEASAAGVAECLGRRPIRPALQHDVCLRHQDGERLWGVVTTSPMLADGGALRGVLCMVTDITARKRAEEAILRANQEWELTFATIPDGIAIIDADYRIVRVNRAMAAELGITAEQAVGRTCFTLLHGLSRPPDNCPHAKVMADGEEHTTLVSGQWGPGHHLLTASPVRAPDGRIWGSVHVVRDISAIKDAEQEVRAAQAFLQSVIDGFDDAVVVLDTEYGVQMINKTARELACGGRPGYEPQFCYQVGHRSEAPCSGLEHRCPLKAVLETQESVTVVHSHTRKDGSAYPVEIVASPIFDERGVVTGVIEVGRDISERLRQEEERKRLEARLFHEQKAESIATLASGIAHDFNNILTTVIGSAELLQARAATDERGRRFAGTILRAGQRMAELTRQLLAYAQGGRYFPMLLPLNPILREALALTHKGKARAVQVTLDLEERLWPVFADREQMHQMVINLLTNAFEALEKSKGCVTLRTANVTLGEGWQCACHSGHPAGEYIRLEISDSGPGIPVEIQDRVFEPFFSTKFLGRGLGLAAAAGICRNHGGCITVVSTPGSGATFQIVLPRALEKSVPLGSGPIKTLSKGDRKILVIDDESELLAVLENILAMEGFGVLTATSGPEGLQLLERERAGIDLVILGLQMPGMDGAQTYRRIKEETEGVRVLVSSGYEEKTALSEIRLAAGDGFIQKPYRKIELLETIVELLRPRSRLLSGAG